MAVLPRQMLLSEHDDIFKVYTLFALLQNSCIKVIHVCTLECSLHSDYRILDYMGGCHAKHLI